MPALIMYTCVLFLRALQPTQCVGFVKFSMSTVDAQRCTKFPCSSFFLGGVCPAGYESLFIHFTRTLQLLLLTRFLSVHWQTLGSAALRQTLSLGLVFCRVPIHFYMFASCPAVSLCVLLRLLAVARIWDAACCRGAFQSQSVPRILSKAASLPPSQCCQLP